MHGAVRTCLEGHRLAGVDVVDPELHEMMSDTAATAGALGLTWS